MHRPCSLIVMLAIFSSIAGCQSTGPETSMDSPAQILSEQVHKRKTPSIQYLFVGPDSVLYRHAEGVADVRTRVPVSPKTRYNGFSVTKTFTAVAILQLAEQGKLALDDPASDYLIEFPYPEDITVRQLLSHSAGIPNPIPLSWIHLREDHSEFDQREFFRPLLSRHSKVKSPPNTRFQYSNLGYVLLGQLVEAVSGIGYEQYVTDNILAPIGVSSDELGFDLDDRQARGYHKRYSFSYAFLGFFLNKSKYTETGGDGWRSFRPYYVNGSAYGGLIGTADGFARYLQALLNPSSGLLSEDSRRMLFSENMLNGDKPSGMSLSWFKGNLEGHDYFAHAGGGGGYYAELRVYPELQRGSVLLMNRSGMSDVRFLDRVDRPFIGMEANPAALQL